MIRRFGKIKFMDKIFQNIMIKTIIITKIREDENPVQFIEEASILVLLNDTR